MQVAGVVNAHSKGYQMKQSGHCGTGDGVPTAKASLKVSRRPEVASHITNKSRTLLER
jgi:hypothetical protein